MTSILGRIFGRRPTLPHNHTLTSIAAAESSAKHAPIDADRIYDLIRANPRTCHEIEVMTGLKHQTASARIRGLFLDGKIRNTGQERKTDSGRLARVWAAA
jgi:hypothetical protein